MENSSPPIKEAFESLPADELRRSPPSLTEIASSRACLLTQNSKSLFNERGFGRESCFRRRSPPVLLFLISVCLELPSSSFAETSLTGGELFLMEGGLRGRTKRGAWSIYLQCGFRGIVAWTRENSGSRSRFDLNSSLASRSFYQSASIERRASIELSNAFMRTQCCWRNLSSIAIYIRTVAFDAHFFIFPILEKTTNKT